MDPITIGLTALKYGSQVVQKVKAAGGLKGIFGKSNAGARPKPLGGTKPAAATTVAAARTMTENPSKGKIAMKALAAKAQAAGKTVSATDYAKVAAAAAEGNEETAINDIVANAQARITKDDIKNMYGATGTDSSTTPPATGGGKDEIKQPGIMDKFFNWFKKEDGTPNYMKVGGVILGAGGLIFGIYKLVTRKKSGSRRSW